MLYDQICSNYKPNIAIVSVSFWVFRVLRDFLTFPDFSLTLQVFPECCEPCTVFTKFILFIWQAVKYSEANVHGGVKWDKVSQNGPRKKFVEDSLWEIWSDMVCLGTPYHFKFFQGCHSQISLGPFSNTLAHICVTTGDLNKKSNIAWNVQEYGILLGHISNIRTYYRNMRNTAYMTRSIPKSVYIPKYRTPYWWLSCTLWIEIIYLVCKQNFPKS